MTLLFAIAYRSTAARELEAADIDRLLHDARSFNAKYDVTGVLLQHGSRFFQYLEGDSKGVCAAYLRIEASSMHTNIVKLVESPIADREIAAWHMGFCEAPA